MLLLHLSHLPPHPRHDAKTKEMWKRTQFNKQPEFAMRGGKMPELGYDGLYKAYTLLPQNPNYRFRLAHALAIRGEYAAASILLDPIAYSPPGSGMRDAALRLKAQFDAQAAEKGKGARPAGSPQPAA